MTRNVCLREDQEQILFATWLRKKGIRFTASANGGKRNLYEAMKFKRLGVSSGWPDIEIPYPIEPYHGLYIELKREKGGIVSESQLDWLKFLRDKGYYAEVANGFQSAVDLVNYYFSLTKQAA